MIKKFIPASTRLQVRVFQRDLRDLFMGQRKKLVQRNGALVDFPTQLKLNQVIKKNNYSDNKIHNLRFATSFIENKKIAPGAILSFWNMIPKPTKKNGYKQGRNLIGNELSLDYGGGLCQLSGILYHLSLIAGLKIIERHPHSKDIYTEESRYTPLGSDATVVYGHKDLRILNPLGQAICFRFEILNEEIIAHVCGLQVIHSKEIIFEAQRKASYNLATVYRQEENKKEIISQDRYERLY